MAAIPDRHDVPDDELIRAVELPDEPFARRSIRYANDGVAAQTLRNLGAWFEAAEDEIMRVLTCGATLDPPGPHQPDSQT